RHLPPRARAAGRRLRFTLERRGRLRFLPAAGGRVADSLAWTPGCSLPPASRFDVLERCGDAAEHAGGDARATATAQVARRLARVARRRRCLASVVRRAPGRALCR